MSNKRRFLILPNPIQGAEDLRCLIGKITLNYASPLDDSVPEDPTPYIKGCLRGDVGEEANEIWGGAGEGSLLQAALKPFAELTYDAKSQETYKLDTKLIRTRSLKNHVKVFDSIWEKHQKDILALMDQVAWRFDIFPDKIYMVTGYKAVSDATRTETSSSSKDVTVAGDAPIGAAAAIPTGGATPPQTMLEGSIKTTEHAEGGSRGTLVGEAVVAVEYRTFKRSWFLSMVKKKSYGTIYDAGVKLFGGGLAMAGPDTVHGEEESGNDFLLDLEEGDLGKYKLEEGEEPDETYWVPCSELTVSAGGKGNTG